MSLEWPRIHAWAHHVLDLVADAKTPSLWTTINIVGGKFNLSGVTSPNEHVSLAKVLRLGVRQVMPDSSINFH